ncbi:MAG: hypothetical protein GDA42_05625 [Ekhidna sp.]|nr:hypothetical protein [Ekhidna sp.]
MANKRYLKDYLIAEIKDYLIAEIKDLKAEYGKFLSELYSGKSKPKRITPWFKLMNIKVQDTMEIVSKKYRIDKEILKNYQIELRNFITDLEEFKSSYKDNKMVVLKEDSMVELMKFHQNNNFKFSSLIIKINEK